MNAHGPAQSLTNLVGLNLPNFEGTLTKLNQKKYSQNKHQ